MKNLALLLLSLAALPAHATDLRCESDDGAFRIEARLPDSVSWRRDENNLKIEQSTITAAGAYRWDTKQVADLVDEPADGGVQWGINGGLLAVKTFQSLHLMVVRFGTWEEGVAKGRLENGAYGQGWPYVSCRLSQ